MSKYVHQYLSFTKRSALILLGLGIMGSFLSAYSILVYSNTFWLGASISFLLLSLVELFLGISRLRTYKQGLSLYNTSKSIFKQSQANQLKVLKDQIRHRKKIEFLLLVLGLVLTIWFGIFKVNEFNLSLAIGWSIPSAILLVDSLILQWRVSLYEHEIKEKV